MKPVVRYRRVENLTPGGRALVWAIDHPSVFVSNSGPAITSVVLFVYTVVAGRIRFETRNTLYVPADDLVLVDQPLPPVEVRE